MISLTAAQALAALLACAAVNLGSGTQIVYQGAVAEINESGEPQEPAKTFDLLLVLENADGGGHTVHWLVDEVGAGAWHWAERFGRVDLAADWHAGSDLGPSLLYRYGESNTIIPVTLPFLDLPVDLTADATWRAGDVEHRIAHQTDFDGDPAWRIEVDNRFGRKRRLLRDPDAPLVYEYQERIFMGRGEEHELSLRLVGIETLPADRFTALTAAFAAFEDLRSGLNLPARTESPDWSADQRETLSEKLPDAARSATGPLTNLARAATQDLELQSNRALDVSDLVAQYVGRPVEPFEIDSLSRQPFRHEDLAGKVTILHFWEYRDTPLKEPYGQVGYLDFLRERHKSPQLQVLGVAVDGRLGDETTRASAVRGVRKLKSFMNLGYDVLLDDGAWIKQLGDPRLVGARLPLVVVIDADGRVAHYHVGYYEVDRDAGLMPLDGVVSGLLKAAPAGD